MTKDKQSHFRTFLREKWFEHQDEILSWTGQMPEYNDVYYFRKHRWMLKQLFKNIQK